MEYNYDEESVLEILQWVRGIKPEDIPGPKFKISAWETIDNNAGFLDSIIFGVERRNRTSIDTLYRFKEALENK